MEKNNPPYESTGPTVPDPVFEEEVILTWGALI